MQRINWFPDPNRTGTATINRNGCDVDFLVVSGYKWMRATTTGSGDIYAQYPLVSSNLPPAGQYHVHAICYAQGGSGLCRLYAGTGNSMFTLLNETGIKDNETKTIDADVTIPSNVTKILVRVVPPSTAGKIILMRDVLIESKTTYDSAVGGASGLLHGGHDAARLTPLGVAA